MTRNQDDIQSVGCSRSRFIRSRMLLCAACLAIGVTTAWATTARGDEPSSAPELLPENTVAYVRIADVPEFVRQLRDTAMGRMLEDPEIQPIVNQLFKSAAEAFRGIEDELGLSIEELRSIPQGEVCLAIVAPEDGSLALVALIGVQQQAANARKLIKFVQAKMVERGDIESTEKVGATTFTIFERIEETIRQTVFVEHDETICVTSDLELAKQLVSAWRSEKSGSTLAKKGDFATIMKRCAGASGEEPQLTYYVDPLGVVRNVAKNNMALQMGLTLLSQHGLNGFHGIGGSVLLGGKNFESVHHTHVLIDSPRKGVLEILAPKTGDITPERWVPSDVATYLTLHWNISKSYAAFAATYDRFRGPGSWDEAVGRSFVMKSGLGLDLEKDLLDALEGRISRVTWASDPGSVGRVATLTGLKLKDASAFKRTLGKVVSGSLSGLFQKRSAAGVTYYEYQARSLRGNNAGQSGSSAKSYAGILGDYLLLSDNEALVKRAIDTKRGALPPLGEELDFKLNASKVSLLSGGKEPSMISFTRPEVGLRSSYNLIQSENTRTRLSEFADQNRFVRAIDAALTEHPLPSFHVLAKYLAFSGRIVTSDDSGIHSVGFTFRRD